MCFSLQAVVLFRDKGDAPGLGCTLRTALGSRCYQLLSVRFSEQLLMCSGVRGYRFHLFICLINENDQLHAVNSGSVYHKLFYTARLRDYLGVFTFRRRGGAGGGWSSHVVDRSSKTFILFVFPCKLLFLSRSGDHYSFFIFFPKTNTTQFYARRWLCTHTQRHVDIVVLA